VSTRPGKGTAIAYGPAEMERLIFALETSEIGLSPATVANLIETQWHRLEPIFRDAQRSVMNDASDADIVLTIVAPCFATGPWLAPDNPPMPAFGKTTIGDLGAHMRLVLGHSTPPPRLIAINLSTRMRDFHAALIVASEGGRRVLLEGEEIPTKEARELASLQDQIEPLRKKFANASCLTPAESRQLSLLLKRDARLRDKVKGAKSAGRRRI
jgi:hypothetical protein